MLQRFGMRIPAVVLALGAAACGPAPDGEWIGMVTDSSGIEIVANPVSGLWRSGGGWQVEEELRIGEADGEAAYRFGRIAGVDADGRGRVYVLDQQAAEVRVFDADGRFLHTIGRKGEGPGELSNAAAGLFVGAGDTILVPDTRLRRVNRYLPDGTSAGGFPIPMTEGHTVRWQMTPSGLLAQQIRSASLSGEEDEEPRDDVVLLRGTDGTIHDTLLTFPPGEIVRASDGMTSFKFFDAEPTWTVDTHGRIIHGVNVEYNLQVQEPGAGTVRMFRKPTARKRLTEADRDRILENAARHARRSTGQPTHHVGNDPPVGQLHRLLSRLQRDPGRPRRHALGPAPPDRRGDRARGCRSRPTIARRAALGHLRRRWPLPRRPRAPRPLSADPHSRRPHLRHWRDELGVEHALRLRIVGIGEEEVGDESLTIAGEPAQSDPSP